MKDLNFTETFIIEEYKALWDYYKKTLDERKKLFDWYLLIITLPSSAIAYLIFNQEKKIVVPDGVSAILLLLIYLIGLSLFITYTHESRNANHYLNAINKIRNHVRKHDKKTNGLLIIDLSRRKNSHFFGLDIIKLSRSFVFILINSAAFSSSLMLLTKSKNFTLLIVYFISSSYIHLVLFNYIFKNGDK